MPQSQVLKLATNGTKKYKEGGKMAEISQNVNIELLEKLPDGTYKRKYPKTRSDTGVTFDEHLAEKATLEKLGHVKAETDADGKLILDIPKSNYNADRMPNENDDETEGYSKGSEWYYTESVGITRSYVCLNPLSGKAEWVQYTSSDGANIVYYSNGLEYVDFEIKPSPQGITGSSGAIKKHDRIELFAFPDRDLTMYVNVYSKEKVRLTEIKDLNFEIDVPNDFPYGGAFRFGLSDDNNHSSGISVYTSHITIDRATNGKVVKSLDVSNLTGYYFIRLSISLNSSSSNLEERVANVFKIWGDV